jgi:isopentenyl-diphosphate Delta-isomerase
MGESLVILVDEKDNEIGVMEKLEAHRTASLHRAISVFVLNSQGEWILQRRALEKYHSRGLWTNTCCTHPFPGESNIDAATRRLMEEMGFKCGLRELFSFIYKGEMDSVLTEHELDHVFVGISDETPVINTNEVVEWKKINFDDLHDDILKNPSHYTFWFKRIYQKVNSCLTSV